jgi:hypothetical protein
MFSESDRPTIRENAAGVFVEQPVGLARAHADFSQGYSTMPVPKSDRLLELRSRLEKSRTLLDLCAPLPSFVTISRHSCHAGPPPLFRAF